MKREKTKKRHQFTEPQSIDMPSNNPKTKTKPASEISLQTGLPQRLSPRFVALFAFCAVDTHTHTKTHTHTHTHRVIRLFCGVAITDFACCFLSALGLIIRALFPAWPSSTEVPQQALANLLHPAFAFTLHQNHVNRMVSRVLTLQCRCLCKRIICGHLNPSSQVARKGEYE